MHDVDYLKNKVKNDFLEIILQLLQSCSSQILDLVNQSILEAGSSLKDLLPSLLDAIVDSIVEKSSEVPEACFLYFFWKLNSMEENGKFSLRNLSI